MDCIVATAKGVVKVPKSHLKVSDINWTQATKSHFLPVNMGSIINSDLLSFFLNVFFYYYYFFLTIFR